MNQSISEPISQPVNQPTISVAPVVPPVVPVLPSKTHDELLTALYWCYDLFDRANMLFFPVFHSARQVKQNSLLSGDHLAIGVRKLEWESGGKRILDAFIYQQGVKEIVAENKVTWLVDNVPIIIHVFPDDLSITQCDTVMYFAEDFKLPNPIDRFEKVFGSHA